MTELIVQPSNLESKNFASVCSSFARLLSVTCKYGEVLILLFSSITYFGCLEYPLQSISPVITSNIASAKQTVALGIPYSRPSKGIEIHAISDAKSRSKLGDYPVVSVCDSTNDAFRFRFPLRFPGVSIREKVWIGGSFA